MSSTQVGTVHRLSLHSHPDTGEQSRDRICALLFPLELRQTCARHGDIALGGDGPVEREVGHSNVGVGSERVRGDGHIAFAFAVRAGGLLWCCGDWWRSGDGPHIVEAVGGRERLVRCSTGVHEGTLRADTRRSRRGSDLLGGHGHEVGRERRAERERAQRPALVPVPERSLRPELLRDVRLLRNAGRLELGDFRDGLLFDDLERPGGGRTARKEGVDREDGLAQLGDGDAQRGIDGEDTREELAGRDGDIERLLQPRRALAEEEAEADVGLGRGDVPRVAARDDVAEDGAKRPDVRGRRGVRPLLVEDAQAFCGSGIGQYVFCAAVLVCCGLTWAHVEGAAATEVGAEARPGGQTEVRQVHVLIVLVAEDVLWL